MSDRGSVTANHYDHVHVSFYDQTAQQALNLPDPLDIPLNPFGTTPRDLLDPLSAMKDFIDGVMKVGAWITDRNNWIRVGEFILGMNLIILGLILIAGGGVGKLTKEIANG